MAKHKQEEHPEDVEVKEEAVETAEQVESVSPEKTELELANERAEDFENKYLRAHAEMQNIQRRRVKNASSCKKVPQSGIWQSNLAIVGQFRASSGCRRVDG